MINTTKWGDCSNCSATNTNVVKRGKLLYCLQCKKGIDNKKQLANQREKLAVRSLNKFQKEINVVPKGTAELQRWFEDRHKEMTGRCKNCSGKTQKDKSNYKNSIGHLLPKAYFPSIATHPDNWIELCFYGNSCHTNFDNKMLDLIDMNCFDEIVFKFVKIYPSIAPNERRRIPPILLEYLKTET